MAAQGLRGWRGWLAVVVICLAGAAIGVAQFDLRRHPSFARVEADLRSAIGLELNMGRVHLDLLAARGLVIRDLEIRLGSFRLHLPEVVARPAWGTWREARLRPSLYADGFDVWVDAEDGADAFLKLKELLELAHFPDAKLALRHGSVRVRGGDPVMHGVNFDLDGIAEKPTLSARARTRRGGRIDVRGERSAEGDLFVHAYPEGLPVADAPSWLASAGMSLPDHWQWPEIPLAVTGRWHLALGADETVEHDFDLNLDGSVVPVALEVRGELRSDPKTWDPESRVRVEGSLGRLRGEQGGHKDMLLSGPLAFELRPSGDVASPRIRGELSLDDAHLWLASRLEKICGVTASFRFDSVVESGHRVSELAFDLGALEVRGTHRGGGPLLATSNWVSTVELASLFPALKERAQGGHARIASLRIEDPERVMAEVQLREISLGGRRLPVEIDDIVGVALVGNTGVEAHDLRAKVKGVPLRTSFQARFGEGGERRLNIDVRAGDIDLAALGLSASDNGEAAEGAESGILRIAEGPVGLLRSQRAHLDDWTVDRARLRIDRLSGHGETYRKLDFVMALRALRLELEQARFSLGNRRFGYAGSIDLNPLVPEVKIAAAP